MDLAIYTGADGYGLLTKYPKPKISLYGHIMTFSIQVTYYFILKKYKFFFVLKI